MKLDTVIIIEAIALLKEFESNSIHLIIADPPYGIGYHSNYYKNKNPHSPIANDWNFRIGPFVNECERVLVEGGAAYLFARWDIWPLWLPSVISSKLQLKTKIVWVKNNWSAGDLRGNFGNQYEEILFLTKGRHTLRGKRWSNIWEFPRIPAKNLLHPAQKPTPLLKRAILASSDSGDLVVDPFAGSGSTGEAAKLTGRRFLLGDIDPKMVNIARSRLGIPLLNINSKPDEPLTNYAPNLPLPEDWGVHPEDLEFIYNELNNNIKTTIKYSQKSFQLE